MLVLLQVYNKPSECIKFKPQFLIDLHGSLGRFLNFQPPTSHLLRIVLHGKHCHRSYAIFQRMSDVGCRGCLPVG